MVKAGFLGSQAIKARFLCERVKGRSILCLCKNLVFMPVINLKNRLFPRGSQCVSVIIIGSTMVDGGQWMHGYFIIMGEFHHFEASSIALV